MSGEAGVGMPAHVKTLVREADVILAINVRFGEMTTDGYTLLKVPTPSQKLIHVHGSDREIGKIYQPALGIQAGPNAFAAALTPGAGRLGGLARPRRARTGRRASTLPPQPSPVDMGAGDRASARGAARGCDPDQRGGKLHGLAEQVLQVRPRGAASGTRSPGPWAMACPQRLRPRWPIPDRTVVCFAGDGDFQMTCQELGTALQAGAQPIVLILNNGIYGTIRAHQERALSRRACRAPTW